MSERKWGGCRGGLGEPSHPRKSDLPPREGGGSKKRCRQLCRLRKSGQGHRAGGSLSQKLAVRGVSVSQKQPALGLWLGGSLASQEMQ